MLTWVDGLFTNVLELVGNIPPAETEAAYYQQQAITAKATRLKPFNLPVSRAVQGEEMTKL